jgi:hypothetical protein
MLAASMNRRRSGLEDPRFLLNISLVIVRYLDMRSPLDLSEATTLVPYCPFSKIALRKRPRRVAFGLSDLGFRRGPNVESVNSGPR